jgi:hypothetical protein
MTLSKRRRGGRGLQGYSPDPLGVAAFAKVVTTREGYVLPWTVTLAGCWSFAWLCKCFVVDPYPLTSDVFKGLAIPSNMRNASCGESVQRLQSENWSISRAHGQVRLGRSHDKWNWRWNWNHGFIWFWDFINAKFWIGTNLHPVNRRLLIKFDQLKNANRWKP